MRVVILQPLAVGRDHVDPGAELDLTDYSAEKLISRGLAKKISKPKKINKKAATPAND